MRGIRHPRRRRTILAGIISRISLKAELSKQVTAHTLRHTAATWLQQATGDPRLVAEYLGHADLSTVSRYAHVAHASLHAAVQTMADRTGLPDATAPLPSSRAEAKPLTA